MDLKLTFSKGLRLSDTLVPDLFITDYLSGLSLPAVKTYLQLLLLFQHGSGEVEARVLAEHCGLTEAEANEALIELTRSGILICDSQKIVLADLKLKEIEKKYRVIPDSDQAPLSPEEDSARSELIRQINDTFYQGVMPVKIYHEIEYYLNTFKFELEVLYALFSEGQVGSGLSNPSYLRAIAVNWFGRGIKTYEDLSNYYSSRREIKSLSKLVRDKMGMFQNLTKPQEDLIRKWTEDFGYHWDIIELAIECTPGTNNPNLRFVGGVLNNWFKAGLHSLEEIQEYEAARKGEREKREASPSGNSAGRKKAAGNFKQRPAEAESEEDFYNFDLLMQLANEAKTEEPNLPGNEAHDNFKEV